jgi:hypothetical protein
MAKTDFKVIDISMKITNQLPMIRITEDLVVTVNNRLWHRKQKTRKTRMIWHL